MAARAGAGAGRTYAPTAGDFKCHYGFNKKQSKIDILPLAVQLDNPQLPALALEIAETHVWAGQAINPTLDGVDKLPEHEAVRPC